MGVGLTDLVDPKKDGELLNRIRTLRRGFTVNMGFPVRLIHIRDNLRLATDDYCVLVRGVVGGKGTLFADQLLTITPAGGGPKLASEVVPEVLSLGGEALGDYGQKTKDPEPLTELVRERLAAHISANVAPDGKLRVLVLSPDIENTIKESIQRTERGTLITLDAGTIARIVGAIREKVNQVSVLHPEPTSLASPEVAAESVGTIEAPR